MGWGGFTVDTIHGLLNGAGRSAPDFREYVELWNVGLGEKLKGGLLLSKKQFWNGKGVGDWEWG